MSGLPTFRMRLKRLKYRRAFVRWQTAIAHGVVVWIGALFALLVIDWSLRLEAVPRLMVISVTIGVTAWRMLRHVVPQVMHDETIVDLGLLLERTHGVDSDLVAALQFDATPHSDAGSPELQRAVIERAAEISETLDFRSAVPREASRRASCYAAIAILAAAAAWFAFPSHASAFWNRLMLGDATYPTRTQIDEIEINGQSEMARVVEGDAVAFRVECSGVTPGAGIVKLRGVETGDSTSVVLKRTGAASELAFYTGDGPSLNEPVEYSIHIGDAQTEPRRIEILRRPLVELTIEAEAPAYMHSEATRHDERFVQVLEGSAVELSVRCTNDKRLRQVGLELITEDEHAEEVETITFTAADRAAMLWRLDAATSGLTRVLNDFQFRVFVVDEDGLETFHPIEGAVRVKRDHAPTATVASSHQAVMPNARPTIAYTAADDFGVGSMVLRARRTGTQGPEESGQAAASSEAAATLSFDLPLSAARPGPAAVSAEYVLDLGPMKLAEHDTLLVWLEVTDYRGTWPGVSAISEPIEIEIMDERGVLDAILRSDADAEQMLSDVIERELGLKGER
ncbi:MAG: hypothetical protein WD070_04650 [Pirellulaceae bacterium]